MFRALVYVALASLQCVYVFAVLGNESIASSRDAGAPLSSSDYPIWGEVVQPHSYPFEAVLYFQSGSMTFVCAGSLISNNLVLTGAHCIWSFPGGITVVLGAHNLSATEPQNVVMETTDFVIHKRFNRTTYENNVALVKLPQDVTINDYIQPIKLASGSDKYEGEKATIIGWGESESGGFAKVLGRANTTILSNAACADADEYTKEIIKPSHICASGDDHSGHCRGDEGGPLVVDGVLVGINFFGKADCRKGIPSLFTRVSDFHDWIERGGTDAASSLKGHFTVITLVAFWFSYFFTKLS